MFSLYDDIIGAEFLSTFLDTQLTQNWRTKSPAVHIGEIALLVRGTQLSVVVLRVVEVRYKHIVSPLIQTPAYIRLQQSSRASASC